NLSTAGPTCPTANALPSAAIPTARRSRSRAGITAPSPVSPRPGLLASRGGTVSQRFAPVVARREATGASDGPPALPPAPPPPPAAPDPVGQDRQAGRDERPADDGHGRASDGQPAPARDLTERQEVHAQKDQHERARGGEGRHLPSRASAGPSLPFWLPR